jgi:O-antigen/teichoic acid export membrane protein
MGRVVGAGMVWMIAGTILAKVITFFAQWVLGKQLSPDEFAVFAYATAIAGFTMVCREAGVREYLVQRCSSGGQAAYEDLAGTGFWLAFWYNIVVAAIMAAIALPLARFTQQPLLAPMLWVMAAALPLGTIGGILQNKMRLELRFRELSIKGMISGITRQGSAIAMALSGVGAMSQAWPVMVGAVVETVGGYTATREKIWKRPAQPHRWFGILRETKWLMFASIANFAVDWGPFLLLAALAALSKITTGPLAPYAHLINLQDKQSGIFYFAFMITAQVGVLLSFNLMVVLTPALARMHDQPQRLAFASTRALRTLMMAGSIGSLGLASIMLPLEHLLWKGKWEQAVYAVVILGVFFPWRVTFGVCSSILQAQGRFRLYAVMTFIEGAGLTLATVAGALVHPVASTMAWWAGIWLLLSRLAVTIWVFRSIGVAPMDVLRATLPSWTFALLAAAIPLALDTLVRWERVFSVGPLASLPSSVQDLFRILLLGSLCSLLFTLMVRVLLKSQLAEVLSVAPARLRRPMHRLLFMPMPASTDSSTDSKE